MERFHRYDAKIPFPFLFHSIPFPNPFANIIGRSFFSIQYPFFFHSVSIPLCINKVLHTFSIPFPFHFLSISMSFFIAKFLHKWSSPFTFHFHSNSIPFLLILILLIFPYLFHYHSTLIPFCFYTGISIISKISSLFLSTPFPYLINKYIDLVTGIFPF